MTLARLRGKAYRFSGAGSDHSPVRVGYGHTNAGPQPSGAMNPKVDWYFGKHERWEKEIRKLRTIALDCQLTEELKWGCPCYTLGGSNIVLIHVFKEYCALLFFKGALLKDEQHILVQQTKNVQAARQIRFTDVRQVVKMERVVKAYILEAIAAHKSGLQVEMKKTAEFAMPDEFRRKLRELNALKKAFHALTPGRQRGYLLYFSSAKQSKTREARIDKCLQRILDGKGLDD
jgi:uncharacterized protein YdeI (YjbR/CyaY-like superfamily)